MVKLKIGLVAKIESKRVLNIEEFDENVQDFYEKTRAYLRSLLVGLKDYSVDVPQETYDKLDAAGMTTYVYQENRFRIHFNPSSLLDKIPELSIPEQLLPEDVTIEPLSGINIRLNTLPLYDIEFYGVDKEVEG
ncbi:hypothetical protein [Maribellus sediminis]|uniref:hypothetical protein n=1 Tax=Maribellus sediminis TaxID=2696285 RepID=UPI00142FF7D8|nr:hypothetical protein [Maribellus sediminis]